MTLLRKLGVSFVAATICLPLLTSKPAEANSARRALGILGAAAAGAVILNGIDQARRSQQRTERRTTTSKPRNQPSSGSSEGNSATQVQTQIQPGSTITVGHGDDPFKDVPATREAKSRD